MSERADMHASVMVPPEGREVSNRGNINLSNLNQGASILLEILHFLFHFFYLFPSKLAVPVA